MSTHRLAPIVVAVAIAVLVVAIAPSAGAKDGDVRVRGTCSAASTVKLKLSEWRSYATSITPWERNNTLDC